MTILICNSCNKPLNLNWKLDDEYKTFCHCQPERSKREDPSQGWNNAHEQYTKNVMGCGALNSMET